MFLLLPPENNILFHATKSCPASTLCRILLSIIQNALVLSKISNGAWEMTPWVKCLLHKHADPSKAQCASVELYPSAREWQGEADPGDS